MQAADYSARFWAKVDKTQDCWLWIAHITPYGYGAVRDSKGLVVGAHRMAYELLVGPIPEGLQIDHLCRVRHCVNPAHLEPVTPAENSRRGLRNQNGAKTHCPKGHPYAGENLIVKNNRRHCRQCARDWARSYQRRRRAKPESAVPNKPAA